MNKTPESGYSPAIAVWVGGVFFVLGTVIAPMAYLKLLAAQASPTWPTTAGVVTGSEIKEGFARDRAHGSRTSYEPHVTYEYKVGGTAYTGRKVSFTEHSGSIDAQWADEVVGRYPRGADVTVHYDPDNPGTAVLEPGVDKDNYVVLGLGLLCLAGGGLPMLAGIVKWRAVARWRRVRGVMEAPHARALYPCGREVTAAARRPAPHLPASVTTHGGAALAADRALFQAPPPEIGPIRSAETSLRQGVRPWGTAGRVGLLVGLIALFLALGWAGHFLYDAHPDLSLVVSISFALLAFGSPGVLAFTRFRHTATYVGRDGLARYLLEHDLDAPLIEEVVRFAEVAEVERKERAAATEGSGARVYVTVAWLDAAGRRLMSYGMSWALQRDGTLGAATGSYEFAAAAAAAWEAHVAARAATAGVVGESGSSPSAPSPA